MVDGGLTCTQRCVKLLAMAMPAGTASLAGLMTLALLGGAAAAPVGGDPPLPTLPQEFVSVSAVNYSMPGLGAGYISEWTVFSGSAKSHLVMDIMDGALHRIQDWPAF